MKLLDRIKAQLPYWLELSNNTSNKIAINKIMLDLKRDHKNHMKNIKLRLNNTERKEYKELLQKQNKKGRF